MDIINFGGNPSGIRQTCVVFHHLFESYCTRNLTEVFREAKILFRTLRV